MNKYSFSETTGAELIKPFLQGFYFSSILTLKTNRFCLKQLWRWNYFGELLDVTALLLCVRHSAAQWAEQPERMLIYNK